MSLEEFDFRPGLLTQLEGANRAGKTTIIKAILSLLGGAADTGIVRESQKAGQIQIVFDDNSQASLKLTANNTRTLTVRDPEGRVVPKPQAYLKSLIDRLVNPLDMLRDDLRPEERLRWVLEALPARVTADQLVDVCKFGTARDYAVAAGEHALVAIDRVYDRLYAERTAANVEREEKRKAQAEMSRSLPPGAEELPDYSAEVERLAAEEGSLLAQRQSNEGRAQQMLEQEKARLRAEYEARRVAMMTEANRKIEAIKSQYKLDAAANEAARDREVAAAESDARATLDQIVEASAARLLEISQDLGIARTKLSESERIKNLLELIDRARSRAKALDIESERRTLALKNLNQLKLDLLADMPLAGIEVRGGEIYKGGVPWPRLNTEQQIDLAVDLAGLRAGKLGLILVDGLERLDPDRQEIFWKKAETTGLQYLATMVTRGPLTVVRLDAAA